MMYHYSVVNIRQPLATSLVKTVSISLNLIQQKAGKFQAIDRHPAIDFIDIH